MEYYNQLKQFLAQAKTDNLKTKHFESEFKETKVKVSFGQGNTAKIPWISFLKEPNTTSNGIYPVYLYYKDYDLLILAYGISETNKPQKKWDIRNKETINDYFKKNFGGKPDRYGNSFVFKIYDLKQELNKQQVEKDLELILSEYTKINFEDFETDKKKLNGINSFDIKRFQDDCKNVGLVYTNKLITRFVSSLSTKPFVILTGLSGSGKTKLAQAFAQWITGDKSQYAIVPVGADWTNREPLLGYPNALNKEEYVSPENGVLDLMIRAKKNIEDNEEATKPYFLILDEMNLSHVERYFADFLSTMESGDKIPLHKIVNDSLIVPPSIKLPKNLFIVGTVNIDETTNMFSPKVLDRANTIEFRVTQDEMKNFLSNIRDIDMDALIGKGVGMAKSFLDMAGSKEFATADIAVINDELVEFFSELKKTGAEFGYRTATEILRLIHQLSVLDNNLTTNQKIDIAIMQKLLPKLHGSRRKLCPVLETLGSFCISGDVRIIKDVFEEADFDFNDANVLYPLSLEKIARMYRGAIDNGFASYAEA